MLVETLEHGRSVFKALRCFWRLQPSRRYLIIDSETRTRAPFQKKKDALVIGRAQILFWSIAYEGSSYSFPTRAFSSQYPSMHVWAQELLWPIWIDGSVEKVAHNWNYDANAFHFDSGSPSLPPTPSNMWDTMLGAWCASEYLAKGLKDRATAFGRLLRETKTVNFKNLHELAEYAEQDVLGTEDLYHAQRFGVIHRPPRILLAYPDGQVRSRPNPYSGRAAPSEVPKEQLLRPFMRNWMYLQEMPVLRATIRAEQRGFPVDLARLYEIRAKVQADRKRNLAELTECAGRTFNPNATNDLKEIVDRLGIRYPYRTKKGAPSFKEEYVAEMASAHPFFKLLAEHKRLSKLVSVYIGTVPCNNSFTSACGLERYVNPSTGAIHATAGTVNAVTGRGSSSNPNLQQIPVRRDKYGVRSVFVATPKAPRGMEELFELPPRLLRKRSLLVLDYAQLELRIMALLCRDPAMVQLLSDPDGDMHTHSANQFGVSRDIAKNLNFLMLYGGMAYMLSKTLTRFGTPTSQETAQGYLDRHLEVYPRITARRLEWLDEHEQNGFIEMFLGRRRTLPDADFSTPSGRHKAETQLSNNAVQGTGQDMLKAAIVRCDPYEINPDKLTLRRLNGLASRTHKAYLSDRACQLERFRRTFRSAQLRFILQVHDELLFTVVPSAAEECLRMVADVMTWYHYIPPANGQHYCVPMVAEGGVGDSWAAAKAKDCKIHVKAGYEHFNNFKL